MFISHIIKMSHRHLIPFIRSRTGNVTKEVMKIDRSKINNKLMKPLKEKDTIRYKLLYNNGVKQ